MKGFVNVTLFDGYYADRYKANINGEIYSVKKNTIMKLHDMGDYYSITLKKKGIEKWVSVHRLIAEMFIPNPENLSDVHHINGNKHDNRVENLKWVDKKTHHRAHKAKPVACIKDGVIIKIYPAIKAVREDGHSDNAVCYCCNHKLKYKSHHGLQWEFLENVSSDLINKYLN